MGKIDPVIEEYRQELDALRAEARDLADQLADKERSITVLEARISGLEEARDLLAAKSRNKSGGRRPRALGEQWTKILRYLALNGPMEFGYAELAGAAQDTGNPVPRQENLRSQMSLYKERGLVESMAEGRFRLTEAGFELLALKYPYGRGDVSDDSDDLPPSIRRPAPSFDDNLESEVPF